MPKNAPRSAKHGQPTASHFSAYAELLAIFEQDDAISLQQQLRGPDQEQFDEALKQDSYFLVRGACILGAAECLNELIYSGRFDIHYRAPGDSKILLWAYECSKQDQRAALLQMIAKAERQTTLLNDDRLNPDQQLEFRAARVHAAKEAIQKTIQSRALHSAPAV